MDAKWTHVVKIGIRLSFSRLSDFVCQCLFAYRGLEYITKQICIHNFCTGLCGDSMHTMWTNICCFSLGRICAQSYKYSVQEWPLDQHTSLDHKINISGCKTNRNPATFRHLGHKRHLFGVKTNTHHDNRLGYPLWPRFFPLTDTC